MRVRKDNLVAKQLDRDKFYCGILPWPWINPSLYICFSSSFTLTEREMILSSFYHNLYGFCAYTVSNGLVLTHVFQKGDLIFTAASRYFTELLMIVTGSNE